MSPWRGFAFCVIALLGVGSRAWADKYVDPVNGSDTSDGDSLQSAYRTVDRAWQMVSDGAQIILAPGMYDASSQGADWCLDIDLPKSVVFRPTEPDAEVVFCFACAWRGVYFNVNDPTKTVTFRHIVFRSAACSSVAYWNTNKSVNGTFEHCTFDDQGSGKVLVRALAETTPTRSMVFSQCTLVSSHIYPIWVVGGARLELNGCDVTSLSTNCESVVYLDGVFTDVLLLGNTFNAPSPCLRPASIDAADRVLVHGNTINMETVSPAVQAIGFAAQNLGSLTITGNTINDLGVGNSRSISVGASDTATAPSYYMETPCTIRDNVMNLKPNSAGITIGHNVVGCVCERNQVFGGNFGFYVQGSSGQIRDNVIVSQNPIVLFHGSFNKLHGNTAVAYGTAESRAIVLGRLTWFGGSLSQGYTNTTYDATSVAMGGGPDLSLAQAVFTMGYGQLMAYTKTSANLQKYGWITDLSDDLDKVTVDRWYRAGGIESPQPPTNGTPFWVVSFPSGNVITNNIFDAGRGTSTITFDYNPQCGEDLIDYNCYVCGSNMFSNLARYASGFIFSLVQMRARWAAWSQLHPDNDSHSIEADPQMLLPMSGDVQLLPTSPCIDAGDPAYNPAWGETDAYGSDRVQGSCIDIGACEFVPVTDCNNNGVPDEIDISNGTSLDLNLNGISDECESWGDMNLDGERNGLDSAPFTVAVSQPWAFAALFPDCDISQADCTQDGVIDALDVETFVAALLAN